MIRSRNRDSLHSKLRLSTPALSRARLHGFPGTCHFSLTFDKSRKKSSHRSNLLKQGKPHENSEGGLDRHLRA
jgi:hypothetical protein